MPVGIYIPLWVDICCIKLPSIQQIFGLIYSVVYECLGIRMHIKTENLFVGLMHVNNIGKSLSAVVQQSNRKSPSDYQKANITKHPIQTSRSPVSTIHKEW